MSDVVIRGGRVVDQHGERVADVLVRGGHVVEVGAGLSGDETLDASGCIVAPGLVDLHVHLREPGMEEAETVETGARAAALGGFTAVVAMPNTEPALDDPAIVASVLAAGERAVCGVFSSGCITQGRAGVGARADGRAAPSRCAHLHRRRCVRRRRGRHAPCARVLARAAGRHRRPALPRMPRSRATARCTRVRGRAGSAFPGVRPRPRTSSSPAT